MTNKINSWTEFQPLKQLVIGTTYPPEFFEDVKNTKAKEILGWNPRPAEESILDIANQMKDLGILK